MRPLLLCLAALALASSVEATSRYYVDQSATGANNGSSWTDAFTDLNDALALTLITDEVWVAAGTYKPTTNNDRLASFTPFYGSYLYGGFAGGETELSQRDPVVNVTILSGDIGVVGDRSDNSRHVVTCPDGTAALPPTLIDGFVIEDGYSDIDTINNNRFGAGVLVLGAAQIRHCVIRDNELNFPLTGLLARGAGVSVLTALGKEVSIDSCTFTDNKILDWAGDGAAVGAAVKNVVISRSHFENNTSSRNGGAVSRARRVSGSTFVNNTAGVDGAGEGGAIAEADTVRKCYFSGNTADSGGAVSVYHVLRECEFFNNSAAYGGAFVTRQILIEVTRCWFEGNAATNRGGAYYSGSSPGGEINSSVFFNNTAETGGALGSVIHLINCTAIGNSATVSGGLTASGATDVRNTISWDNSSPTGPTSGTAAAVTFYNSLVETSGGSGSWNASVGNDGGGNIDAEPFFVEYGVDFHIGGQSPGWNSGDNAVAPAEDYSGQSRIADGTVDMGAFETTCTFNAIAYVDDDAIGAKNGTSWANAYTRIRDALVLPCTATTQVWVADGVYPVGSDTSSSLVLYNDFSWYGGFAGSEATLGERDLSNNESVLTGELGPPGVVGNIVHVVDATGTNSTAVLDGFTITGGAAKAVGVLGTRGGGVWLDGGAATFRNLVLHGNFARNGGAIGMQNGATPTFTNVVAFDNEGEFFGGFMYALDSSPVLVNVTATENVSANGALCFVAGGAASVTNTIVWNNDGSIHTQASSPTFSHSLIEGSGGSGSWNTSFGNDGGDNIDADPLFAGPGSDDFQLTMSSPAVDAGDNAANTLLEDALGNARVSGGFIDMGAYEFVQIIGLEPVSVRGADRAYPNPFNPAVTIEFVNHGHEIVDLAIFDVAGRRVASPTFRKVEGLVRAMWDGTTAQGHRAVGGVYFARLETSDRVATVKLVLVK